MSRFTWPLTVGLGPLFRTDVQLARFIWMMRAIDPRDLPVFLGLPSATSNLGPDKFELLSGPPDHEIARVPTCPYFQLTEWAASLVGIDSLVGATRLCGMIEWQEDVTPRDGVLWLHARLENRRTPQRACLAIATALRQSLITAAELSKNRSDTAEIQGKPVEALGSEEHWQLAELKAKIEAAERFLGWARIAEVKLKDLGEKEVARWVYEHVYLPLIAQAVGEKRSTGAEGS